MRFFVQILAIIGVIVININEVKSIECCKPTTILFRHLPEYTCDNFPNSSQVKWGARSPPSFYGRDPRVCATQICKDGRNHEHCSIGKCECKFWILGCDDTANKCYDDYDTIEDAFAKKWAKKHQGVYDFMSKDGEIISVRRLIKLRRNIGKD